MKYNQRPPTRDEQIVGLYKALHPASEIAQQFDITDRQVQRIVKKAGVSRTISESYRLAIKQGRMTYYHKPNSLKVKRKGLSLRVRYQVLERDDYICQKCGKTVGDGIRIEVDHIDENPQNNSLDNLQTLCNLCNQGKAQADE